MDSVNFIQICELQRDFRGYDELIQNNRRFIRQGCLLKHSKKGLQQTIFFLFSDIFFYGIKSPIDQTFRIQQHLPVKSLLTENGEHNTFSIFGGQYTLTVSAGTTAEKTLWLAELSKATSEIKSNLSNPHNITLRKNCSKCLYIIYYSVFPARTLFV